MKYNTVAIITARGGSKRIPKKNIKDFHGRPIISYTIDRCKESNLFDYIIVSTDNQEIAEVAIQHGAEVPFFRSKENSDDFSTTTDVLLEVLDSLSVQKKYFNYLCCLYPTAPLLQTSFLSESYRLLINRGCSGIIPVVKYDFPIQRAFCINDGLLQMIAPENMLRRSQDLNPSFHDAGQFYWLKVNDFLVEKLLYMKNIAPYVLPNLYVQDIDTEEDWELAELKYKYLLTKHSPDE